MYRQSIQTGRGDNDIGEYTSDSIIIIIIVIRMSYTRRLEGGDQSGQLPALSHCYLRSFLTASSYFSSSSSSPPPPKLKQEIHSSAVFAQENGGQQVGSHSLKVLSLVVFIVCHNWFPSSGHSLPPVTHTVP